MRRETAPCSSETAFAYADVRNANGVIPKPLPYAGTSASDANSSHDKPVAATASAR
jgi:hypothetical protein